MSAVDIEQLAATVDGAALEARAMPALASRERLTLEDAYRVQRASVARREQRGERVVGVKMGFTSRAKMEQMGVSELIWGRLTDRMLIEDGGVLPWSRFIHPRVEPEIAFVLKHALAGPVTPPVALAAVEAIAPALEIIDSRFEQFRFSVTDVVADNASSAAFVVGPWNAPTARLDNLGLVVEVNGRVQAVGSTAAILGHPLRSLVAAARLAAAEDLVLGPGWIVMAGGATAAVPLKPGDGISCEMQSLGRVGFDVSPAIVRHGDVR